MAKSRISFPPAGSLKEDILAELAAEKEKDIRWREGKAFSLVFHAGEEASALLEEAQRLYLFENALNPTAFPSLRRFETEVVGMAADLLGGDEHVIGNMTSGGTESCLLAVKTARDWFLSRNPHLQTPEIILPFTAHPAFEKAAQYFGVKAVHIGVREDFRANLEELKGALRPETALIVGSAPSYPQGVVDPIAEMARIALNQGILCHVDACVGGFMLPFVQRLGYAVPEFDFRVPGVTSISADLHKYGYTVKGASLILYRNHQIRRHQFFAYVDWPGGIYASPSITGTRPAGPIAAAWALLKFLGEQGYLEIAEAVMKATWAIREGIEAMPGIRILGDPEMSVMAIGSDELDVYQIGDEMGLRGWHLDRQQFPPSLHLTINYAHLNVVDEFLQDLRAAVDQVRKPSLRKLGNRLLLNLAQGAVRLLPEGVVSRMSSQLSRGLGTKGTGLPTRTAPMYGMMGSLPNRGDLAELVLDLLDQFTTPQDQEAKGGKRHEG